MVPMLSMGEKSQRRQEMWVTVATGFIDLRVIREKSQHDGVFDVICGYWHVVNG
jgi:hypothetical protein